MNSGKQYADYVQPNFRPRLHLASAFAAQPDVSGFVFRLTRRIVENEIKPEELSFIPTV